MASPQLHTIPLPPGPLGVGIQRRGASGHCVVSSKATNTATTTPLEVNDVIISLNGITLNELHGGVNAWVKLFNVFQTGEMNLIVQRRAPQPAVPFATATGNATQQTVATSRANVRVGRDAAEKKKMCALKDSTKHNAAKKQKVDGNTPAANKSALGKSTRKTDKSSSQPGNQSSTEVISLLDDSDDDSSGFAAAHDSNITGGFSSGNKKQRKKIVESSNANMNIEVLDSDIEDATGSATTVASKPVEMEVSTSLASLEWRRASSLSSSSSRRHDCDYSANNSGVEVENKEEERGEEELTIVATKGQNALVDFPHSRANCVTHPFLATFDKKIHCDNCYCYVCDIPAPGCKAWPSHCEASHDDPRWREERERAKRRARELALAPTQASASAACAVAISRSSSSFSFSLSRSSSSTLSSTNTNAYHAELSVRKLFEKITTVHPIEMQPPVGSGFTTPLRHYQKQSLAFMVDTERTSNRGGWLCDEVGMGKSAVVLALVATNRASPKTLATKQQVKETIKTADANDRKVEQIEQYCNAQVRSMQESLHEDIKGMDEYCRNKRVRDFSKMKEREHRKKTKRLAEIRPVGKIKLKPTVILTSVSLIGQWEDEIKKHAPGLVVKTYHGS